MGRSEGPGCYCAVNHNLREVIDTISKNYRYVIIDNEAGMEHLSRRTTRDVQHLLVISDPTLRGIVAAERIAALRNELDIEIENTYLIINRLEGNLPPALEEKIQTLDIPLLGIVPADDLVTEFDYTGKPLFEVDRRSTIFQAVAKMMAQIIPGNSA
jgi:CO dehydrogenase maturation factor